MSHTNILITVDGGRVTEVSSNQPGVHVTVFDYDDLDCADLTPDEIRTAGEVVGIDFPHDTSIWLIDKDAAQRLTPLDSEGAAP